MQAKAKRERFWELDFVRGICVILMIFDHAMQLMFLSSNKDLVDLMQRYMATSLQNYGHIIVRIIFFLVCGISCVLSKSNAKRGLMLLGVACALTFGTTLMDTTDLFFGMTIYFGVLHMLAISILYSAVLLCLSQNIPRIGKFIPAFFGVLCLLFYYLYIKGKYASAELGYIPSIVGLEVEGLVAGDHAPLFPEMAYVLIGTGIGQFYRSKYKSILKPLDGLWNRPVCFFGRHALVLYLATSMGLGAFYTLF